VIGNVEWGKKIWLQRRWNNEVMGRTGGWNSEFEKMNQRA
jgi:hypothetical protein